MFLVEDNTPLSGAGRCFICEQHIARPEVGVVDTNREFELNSGPSHPLEGRKYVCEECGTSLGYLFGMVRADDVALAKQALEETRAQLGNLQRGVENLADAIHKSVENVLQLPVLDLPDAVTVKEKKPSVRPVKDKADPKGSKA